MRIWEALKIICQPWHWFGHGERRWRQRTMVRSTPELINQETAPVGRPSRRGIQGRGSVAPTPAQALTPPPAPARLPNLERAAHLLNDLPAMWVHPATNDRQRESLVQELPERATVSGTSLVGVRPRPVYQPLFGYIMASRGRIISSSPPVVTSHTTTWSPSSRSLSAATSA